MDDGCTPADCAIGGVRASAHPSGAPPGRWRRALWARRACARPPAARAGAARVSPPGARSGSPRLALARWTWSTRRTCCGRGMRAPWSLQSLPAWAVRIGGGQSLPSIRPGQQDLLTSSHSAHQGFASLEAMLRLCGVVCAGTRTLWLQQLTRLISRALLAVPIVERRRVRACMAVILLTGRVCSLSRLNTLHECTLMRFAWLASQAA